MASDINTKILIDIQGNTADINSKLDQLGGKATQAGDKTRSAGDEGSQGLKKLATSADSAKIAIGTTVTSIQAMSSQISGLAQQVLDFDSKIIALQKTAVGLESQEIALRRSVEDLNKAVAEGTIEEREYHRALEDIELAYKNMVLESRNVEAETKKLGGEFVSFGINSVGVMSGLTVAIQGMSFAGATGFKALALGAKAFGSALWTIAKHPVFLIITAGIIAWELGLKSIVEQLTGIDDLGIFSNLQKVFEGLTGGESSMEELDRQTRAYGDTVEQNLPVWASEADAIEEVGNAAEKTTKKIKGLTKSQEHLIRQSGFSPGPGKPLSEALNTLTDELDIAAARTLAAASLHKALDELDLDRPGPNISGRITRTLEQMRAAGRLQEPNFADSSRIRGLSIAGSGQKFTGINGLTRSSQLRRRGRNDKGSVRNRIDAIINEFEGLPNQQALIELTGLRPFGSGGFFPRFGNNAGLGRFEREDAIFANLQQRKIAGLYAQGEAYRALVRGAGLEGAKYLAPERFLKLRDKPGAFAEIEARLLFERRTGAAVTGVTT